MLIVVKTGRRKDIVATKSSKFDRRDDQGHLRKNGVIGVTAGLVEKDTKSIAKWIAPIEHIVSIGGIDHVGIGTDYFLYTHEIGVWPDIMEWVPGPHRPHLVFEGMAHPADFPRSYRELLRRGFMERDLCKNYRDNYLRVMLAVLG